jgi:hypothetical protein
MTSISSGTPDASNGCHHGCAVLCCAGDLIRLSDCTGATNQRWFLDALFRLRPYHVSSKCMDIRSASTALGAILQIFNCLDNNQQMWTVIP